MTALAALYSVRAASSVSLIDSGGGVTRRRRRYKKAGGGTSGEISCTRYLFDVVQYQGELRVCILAGAPKEAKLA